MKFLFPAELKLKKEEEKKERRRQREVAAYDARMLALDRHVLRDEPLTLEESYAWRKWAGHLPGRKRKRKKKRKKKVPQTSSSSSFRLHAHQDRRVPGFFVSVRFEMPTMIAEFLAVLSRFASRRMNGVVMACGTSRLAHGSSFVTESPRRRYVRDLRGDSAISCLV